MRKILLVALLFPLAVSAQDTAIPAEEIIYKDSIVDVQPEFPGGIDNFYAYFSKTFKPPQVRGLVDKVVLSFVVETDGTLTDIRVVHDAGFGTSDQTVAILEQGPKWTPGSKDNKKVRVLHLLPIAIITEE